MIRNTLLGVVEKSWAVSAPNGDVLVIWGVLDGEALRWEFLNSGILDFVVGAERGDSLFDKRVLEMLGGGNFLVVLKFHLQIFA